MKYVQSAIALGLFSWLGYAVYTDTLPIGDGGSGKTRALSGVISNVTEQFGVTQTSIGLGLVGLLLAVFFLLRPDTYYEE